MYEMIHGLKMTSFGMVLVWNMNEGWL